MKPNKLLSFSNRGEPKRGEFVDNPYIRLINGVRFVHEFTWSFMVAFGAIAHLYQNHQ